MTSVTGFSMDSLIVAAAQALAVGDPIGALSRVALREDPPALALRGIAMAQLGELDRARALLKRAATAFGPREGVARARCVVAQAEIALVSRDLGFPPRTLEQARAVLSRHGDVFNAAHAGLVEVRRLVLLGRLDEAEFGLAGIASLPLPPAHRAAAELVGGAIAMRRLATAAAAEALARAAEAARRSGIAGLEAEVARATEALAAPAAHRLAAGTRHALGLADVEALFASGTLVVDACRRVVRRGGAIVPLASRPVLFALARALAEAAPGDVTRATLVARAFGGRDADESHRARLRVEIGRLRAALRGLATLRATREGFVMAPAGGEAVVVIAPPIEEGDEQHAALLALLADGEAWSSSALALVLGASPRTVQRALETLAAGGRAIPVGKGRARRWITPPMPGFPTTLLLPAPLPRP